MTYPEIHQHIHILLHKKIRVFKNSPHYTANFYDDFGFAQWELSWLLNTVEDHFQIDLEEPASEQIATMNQLVDLVHRKKQLKNSTLLN